MLTRTSPGNFEDKKNTKVRIVHKSSKAGTNQATYRYAQRPLAQKQFDTSLGELPGCQFTVESGARLFKAACVFETNAPSDARYDFFELLQDDRLNLLESKSNDGDPVLVLRIKGI